MAQGESSSSGEAIGVNSGLVWAVCSNEADQDQSRKLEKRGAVMQLSGTDGNRQLKKGPEAASSSSGPREGEMMNQVYIGILQQQKDKQLQGGTVHGEDWRDILPSVLVQDTRSEMGLNIGSSTTKLRFGPELTWGPQHHGAEVPLIAVQNSWDTAVSQDTHRELFNLWKKYRVQMPLSLLVCFPVICFSLILSHYF